MLPFPADPQPSLPQPSRSGPWNEPAQDLLVELVRGGSDLEGAARELGRGKSSVTQRLRRLLPPEVRGCPADRVLAAAREAFAEPGYDWRRTILLSPPPPPVVQRTYAGVPGLESEDLVTVAYALIASGGTREVALLDAVGREIERRNETHHLVSLRTTRALHERGSFLDRHASSSHAEDWVTHAEGWPQPSSPYWYSPEPY